jgi:hypothetical protein
MARLIANVHVIEPAKPGGPGEPALIPGEEHGWFGPDYGNADDVPAKVARLIPNPKAWEDGELPTFDAEDEGGEPPRAGKGSGTETWRAYAVSLGIDVPADKNRDEIVALVDAHRADQS